MIELKSPGDYQAVAFQDGEIFLTQDLPQFASTVKERIPFGWFFKNISLLGYS